MVLWFWRADLSVNLFLTGLLRWLQHLHFCISPHRLFAGDDDEEEEEGGKSKIQFAPLSCFCTFLWQNWEIRLSLQPSRSEPMKAWNQPLLYGLDALWDFCSGYSWNAGWISLKSKTPDGLLNTLAFVIFPYLVLSHFIRDWTWWTQESVRFRYGRYGLLRLLFYRLMCLDLYKERRKINAIFKNHIIMINLSVQQEIVRIAAVPDGRSWLMKPLWSDMEMKRASSERDYAILLTGMKNVLPEQSALCILNEENLCDLYKALGPDSLCDTCRMYPRHTEEYEGLLNCLSPVLSGGG